MAEAIRSLAPCDPDFPGSICATTRQWREESRSAFSGGEYVAIDAPRIVHYIPPERDESALDRRFSLEALHHAPATFCAAIPHGRVWGTGGAVISPDNRLLADVSEELGLFIGDPRNHSLFRQWKLPASVFVKGSIAVLASSGGWNYFHWMFDSLPRLGLLRAAFPEKKVDLYLVNRPLSPFQLETLGGLGISPEDVRICEASTFIEAEELLVPSLPGLSGFVSRRSCEFLRRNFGAPQKPKTQRRLYISRENSNYRRVIDEEKLIAALQAYGFETLHLERMTVTGQAAAFSEAEVILGPHGAGHTNYVFCQPGAKVLEIFSPHYVSPCYWTLASEVGLRYFYILGVGKRSPANDWGEADIRIDYPALHRKLALAGIERVR